MRFSVEFSRAFYFLLKKFFPIWGGIAVLISLLGVLIALIDEEISTSEALYFAWVTGTTVGYGDLAPTVDVTRFLAIIIGINGIVLTGITVTMAIEAAKIAIENSVSIEAFRQEAKERSQRRFSRERDRPSKQGDEEA